MLTSEKTLKYLCKSLGKLGENNIQWSIIYLHLGKYKIRVNKWNFLVLTGLVRIHPYIFIRVLKQFEIKKETPQTKPIARFITEYGED